MNLLIIVGSLIGFSVGRWTGLFIGGFIGWWISKKLRRHLVHTLQTRFLDSTFAVMGAVCKADGRVSQNEIRVAEQLFDRLRLGPDARNAARIAFNRGKLPGFDLDGEVRAFAQAARNQRVLVQMFLQVQFAAASADGPPDDAGRRLLLRIARGLGLSDFELQRMEAQFRVHTDTRRSKLDDAYATMGVPAEISNDDLKKAYRKLMSENHPDKLAARGLPESMRQMAEEKTRDITAAYDLIKEARGIA